MDSDSIHNLAAIRGGLTKLSLESGNLRPRALLRELDKLRDLFEGIRIPDDDVESAVNSAATKVFKTYELTEMVLQRLPLEDLVKAQQVCRMSSDVCRDSKRVRGGHSAHGVDRNPFCVKPFKRILDFDLSHAGHTYRDSEGRHLVQTEPYDWLVVEEKPGASGLMLIVFEPKS